MVKRVGCKYTKSNYVTDRHEKSKSKDEIDVSRSTYNMNRNGVNAEMTDRRSEKQIYM